MNSGHRPNRDNQFDDLNRSTLHRQVTVQSPQPNSPAKKPAVICINVIILHSSASNVLHQYFSDQNPQSVSDFIYILHSETEKIWNLLVLKMISYVFLRRSFFRTTYILTSLGTIFILRKCVFVFFEPPTSLRKDIFTT